MKRDRVRVAFIDNTEIIGLGWDGHVFHVQPGAYLIAEPDGMQRGHLMLLEPGTDDCLAIVQEYELTEIREVKNGADPIGWATYYRNNPEVLSTWGEQNGRFAPKETP